MLRSLSQPSSRIVVGVNDHCHFQEGWHERSVDSRSGVIYRPSMSRAGFQILKQPAHARLALLLSGAPYLLRTPILVKVKRGDEVLSHFSLTTENWVFRYADITRLEAGSLDLTIETTPVYIPHDYFRNGDFRELGVYVAAVVVT